MNRKHAVVAFLGFGILTQALLLSVRQDFNAPIRCTDFRCMVGLNFTLDRESAVKTRSADPTSVDNDDFLRRTEIPTDVLVRWTNDTSFQVYPVEDTEDDKQLLFLRGWKGYSSYKHGGWVKYLRNFEDIYTEGNKDNCTSSLHVLQWLTNEMSIRNCSLMIAYGELIHVFREKSFFANNSTTKYLDDDIDIWAASITVYNVIQLEPVIFKQFGWTVRLFISREGYVVFLQLMPACGHKPVNIASKITASEPALEIYVIQTVSNSDGSKYVQDLWQGTLLSESLVYPPVVHSLKMSGFSETLHLQVPNRPRDILTCIYGEWTQPSSAHSGMNIECL